MKKWAAFDLEIVKQIPDGLDDWWSIAPLGISCAAVALSDSPHCFIWHRDNELGMQGSRALVAGLLALVDDGYTLVGFNSLGFDFRVLALESGLIDECQYLAMGHIDLFFHLFCRLGYGPGLDRLAKGMGLTGKPEGIDGAKAPELWAEGKRQEVIDYCVGDARMTLSIAHRALDLGGVQWTSKSGNPVIVDFERWDTAVDALQRPEPDTAWMDTPWQRSKFTGWLK